MPAKGTTLRVGERHPVFSKDFVTKLKNDLPHLNYSQKELKEIFDLANLKIKEEILKDPSGFRLPCNMGILAVSKYKHKTTVCDYRNSRDFKKKIPYLNLHSFGNMFAIKYYRVSDNKIGDMIKFFKFHPTRDFKRNLAKVVKETGGEEYMNHTSQSFFSKRQLTKLFTVK